MNWWILGWWSITFLVGAAWSQPEEDRVLHKTSEVSKKENFAAERSVPLGLSDDEIKTIQELFAKRVGLDHYKEIDVETFRSLLENVFVTQERTMLNFIKNNAYCGLCKLLILKIQLSGLTKKVAEFICNTYHLEATLSSTGFCKQVVDLNMPVLEYVVNNSKILDPELACTILLQRRDCYYPKPALSWVADIPSSTPVYPNNTRDPSKRSLKVLHLTDPHISLDYEHNGAVKCGYPLCCKKGLGNVTKGQNAGYWGEYDCDIPSWLYESTLQHISDTHKDLDYIYFTGDIVDHTIWNTTIESNTEVISHAFRALQEKFPTTPVFAVIGNHESHPSNMYAPHKEDIIAKALSTNWLYDLMAKLWSPWLPENALNTVRLQGYYAYSVTDKLKIIGLNNNVCFSFNWWLLLDTEYIKEQLQFLIRELEESEQKRQFVHILAHISVGNQECIEPWEVSYNKIVQSFVLKIPHDFKIIPERNDQDMREKVEDLTKIKLSRYAHIIKGQFVGHTHTDELKIFYDNEKNPINIVFNGASLTPYVQYNPNYKIMHVDPDTLDILDVDTYYFNLTEANLNPNRSPAWKKLYSMKEAYNLPDLSPKSFDVFADRLFNDTAFINLYYRNYVSLGDASLKEGCDNKCLQNIRCKVVTTRSLHPQKKQCSD